MTLTEWLPLPDARTGTEVDLLASALNNALQSESAKKDDKKDDKNPSIEIIVDSDTLILRGTGGAEVAPALLSGRVVLHLTESTPLKQISLHFRGKAKLPPLANEPLVPSLLDASLSPSDNYFLTSASVSVILQ